MEYQSWRKSDSGDFVGVVTEKGEEAAFPTAGVSFSGVHDLGIWKAKAR